MHLILVAPGLLAQPQSALDAAPSLAMLAHLAPTHAYGNGIAAALLDALEAPAQTPIAPLAALGGDFDAGNDYVIAADPVLLAADRDDLVLVQRVDERRREPERREPWRTRELRDPSKRRTCCQHLRWQREQTGRDEDQRYCHAIIRLRLAV